MQSDSHDPIQVLQVVDKFSIDGRSLHGVARLLSWWIEEIHRDRFELSILCLNQRTRAGRYLEEKGGRVFYSDRGKVNPASIFDLLGIAWKTNADLLHLHGYKSSAIGRIAGMVLGIPVVLHEHASFPKVPIHQRIADWLLAPFGDKMIVVSDTVKDFCMQYRYINPEKIVPIFNGIPLAEFQDVSSEEAQEAAREIGIDYDAPIVGTVARLDEEKGVEHLLHAVPIIKEEVPNVQVLIVGDGVLRDELEEKANRLGIEDDTVFTGERRDVPRMYKIMDVKIISSIREGGPLTLFEAMAVGTPVVATPVGLVSTVIQNGWNGKIVEPRSPVGIAEASIELLGSKKKREVFSKRSKEKVKPYGIKESVKRIKKEYDSILKG